MATLALASLTTVIKAPQSGDTTVTGTFTLSTCLLSFSVSPTAVNFSTLAVGGALVTRSLNVNNTGCAPAKFSIKTLNGNGTYSYWNGTIVKLLGSSNAGVDRVKYTWKNVTLVERPLTSIDNITLAYIPAGVKRTITLTLQPPSSITTTAFANRSYTNSIRITAEEV